MNNKKINKGILTGLAAITLFAPMVLHNTQVNASTSIVQTSKNNSSSKDKTSGSDTNSGKNDVNNTQNNDTSVISRHDRKVANILHKYSNNVKSVNFVNSDSKSADQVQNTEIDNIQSVTLNKANLNNDTTVNQATVKGDYVEFEKAVKPVAKASKHDEQVAEILRNSNYNKNIKSVNFDNSQGKSLDQIQGTDVGNIKSITLNKANSDKNTTLGQDKISGNVESFKQAIQIGQNNDASVISKHDRKVANILHKYSNNVKSVNFVNSDSKSADQVQNTEIDNIQSVTLNKANLNNDTTVNQATVKGDYVEFEKAVKPVAKTPKHDEQVAAMLRNSNYNKNIQSVNFDNSQGKSLDQIQGTDVSNIKSITLNKANSDKNTTLGQDKISGNVGSFKQAIQIGQNNNDSSNSSAGSSVNVVPTNNSSNNSHYVTPKTNNGSAQIGFPDAPTVTPKHKAGHHKAPTRKAKKVSAKQMKSDKASVKKNQKHLKDVKKALRKAKGKARKAKLNKQLRKAKKAFAKSEKKLNHAIHNAK